jgi:pimeloyl-ACP methyl ester carboxylesterase
MNRLLRIAALLVTVATSAYPGAGRAAGANIGVVLLHGKLGIPIGDVPPRGRTIGAGLVAALRRAHYLVATPEMCYSRRRQFDATYEACLRDVDAAIAGLKAHGANGIVIGGLSMGGNMAIAYAATHAGLLGVIGLSPADDPTRKELEQPQLPAEIANAQALIAAGKGDVKTSFDDINTGPQGTYAMTLTTTPRIFLSFEAVDSLANIPATAARLTVPLLWVAGNADPTQVGEPDFGFAKAPPNALNRYVEVSATHLEVADASTDAVLAWLAQVSASR